MNGGDLVDDPIAPTRLTLDTPESKEALQWFMALQLTHQVTPDAVAEEAESSLSRFINGRLAMFMDSRLAVPEFRERHLPQRKRWHHQRRLRTTAVVARGVRQGVGLE